MEQPSRLRDLHGTESKDDGHRYLLLVIHLQLANNENGNNGEGPVCDARKRRVSVERPHDDLRVNAMSGSARELFPEKRNRRALKDEQEEEEEAVRLYGDEGDP